MIAVFDIDGVLADATHRQHYLQSRPKDWQGFFRAVGDDGPIARGIDLVREAGREGPVVLLSGRPESTRAATEAMYMLLKLAADDLGYRRLVWKCNALNAPSKRAADRLW